MADHLCLQSDQGAGDKLQAHSLHPGLIQGRGGDAAGLPGRFQQVGRDGVGIHQAGSEEIRATVGIEGVNVVGHGIVFGLPLLGHEIRHIDPRHDGAAQGIGNAGNQEIRDQAGVQAAGTQ